VAEFCVPTAKAFLTNTRVLAPSFGIATRSAVLRSIRKNSAKLDPRIVASLVVSSNRKSAYSACTALRISISTTYVFDTSGSFPGAEWLDIAEKACS